MTDLTCQLCRQARPDTKFRTALNGTLCPSCSDYVRGLQERNKAVPAAEVLPQEVTPTPQAPRQVPLPTAPPAGNAPPPPQLRPNTPGIQRTRVTGPASRPVPVTGSFATPEIYNTLTQQPTVPPVRSPIVEWQPMAAANVECEVEEPNCHERATHHLCDQHMAQQDDEGWQAPPPIAGASPEADEQEPPSAFVVMLARRDPLYVVCLGVFPLLVEAENCVRALYLKVEYGIESPGDAMLRPERYGMTLQEVQAACGEADEAILRMGQEGIPLDEEQEVVRITVQQIS